MRLSNLFVPLLTSLASVVASPQTPRPIVNDLPRLSHKVIVGDCSSGLYGNHESKWTDPYRSPSGSNLLRAHISSPHKVNGQSFTVEILDSKHVLLQTLYSGQISSTGVWTTLFDTPSITVNLKSDGSIDGSTICLDYVNTSNEPYEVKSITGLKDERVDLVAQFGKDSRYYAFGKAVVLIRFLDTDGNETNCTGVFVKPTIVATNNHCIDENTDLTHVQVILFHETGSTDSPISVNKLLATCRTLDYSLLRVSGRSVDVASISMDEPPQNTPLVVIQHPAARNKRISVRKCRVESSRDPARDTDFFHLCDTSGGSSGSPVMNATTGVVYGLHHIGLAEAGPNHYHNLAVYMHNILSDLKDRDKGTFAELTTGQ